MEQDKKIQETTGKKIPGIDNELNALAYLGNLMAEQPLPLAKHNEAQLMLKGISNRLQQLHSIASM